MSEKAICEPPRTTDESPEDPVDDHLHDVEPGAGCTEIWEHLSEQREE